MIDGKEKGKKFAKKGEMNNQIRFTETLN